DHRIGIGDPSPNRIPVTDSDARPRLSPTVVESSVRMRGVAVVVSMVLWAGRSAAEASPPARAKALPPPPAGYVRLASLEIDIRAPATARVNGSGDTAVVNDTDVQLRITAGRSRTMDDIVSLVENARRGGYDIAVKTKEVRKDGWKVVAEMGR